MIIVSGPAIRATESRTAYEGFVFSLGLGRVVLLYGCTFLLATNNQFRTVTD